MKKLSHISFLNLAVLALAVLVFGSVGAKTFAATNYLSYTPVGCNVSLMEVIHLNSGQLINGANLQQQNTGFSGAIYVIDDTPIEINGDITIGSDCVSVVANAEAGGNTVLNFTGDHYITSNGPKNIYIGGANSSKRLELNNISNSPVAIMLQNISGANISYTSISGFTNVFGGIAFSNVNNSKIISNIITNNIYGILFQSNSANNEISNNEISNNTNEGILLQAGSNNTIISYTILTSNGGDGISIMSSNGFTISYNTGDTNYNTIHVNGTTNSGTIRDNVFTNNAYAGLTLDNEVSGLTISNNKTTNNSIGLDINGSKSNNFNGNTISGNSYGIYLKNSASGNIFTNEDISLNIFNIDITDSHNNYFTNTTTQDGSRGIKLTTSNYNIFSGVNVINNTDGTKLNAASNNTLNLTNNNNGITLVGGSNNNSIYNKQPTNNSGLLNNITISDGSNNIITGGLFSASSTTSTSVVISLKNNQTSPKNYSITGAGLSGTYSGIMTGSTGNITIQLSAGDGTKNIVVTYNNGNKQYDSIVLNPTSGGGSNGGGGGGGGGGSVTPTCTSANLVCVNGVRTRIGSTTCQGDNLGHACTVTSGTTSAGTSGSIVGSPFSSELNNAYLRAFANGVTTMNTIQKANMTGALIRAHMAKMISNFAITLGGLTPDTSKQCVFTDIASQSAEMKFYIKLSCQLGLMGQGITKFDPTAVVTRAQFGTILSRVLWGDRYEGGVKYYTDHLAALKRATIMTQIENPNAKEIRGYVMIMMKRAQDLGYLTD